MGRTNKPFHWQSLFRVVSRRAYQLIEAHNLQFPTQAEQKQHRKRIPELEALESFSLAYPRRIKESEEKTILNVLKQWCKQTEEKINAGEKRISNLVFTNRKSARNFKRAARGSNHHFAKGVFCGCLIGEKDETTAEYKCQFTYPDGRGIGVRPWKRFHGTNQDFELCINPELIPRHLLPEDVKLEIFDPYAVEPEKKYQAQVVEAPPKAQKMPPFPDQIETLKKEISQTSVDVADGNSKEVASFARLFLDGQVQEAYAQLLIDSYEQKLAKAMDRNFSPAELARGKEVALSMLKTCDPDALEGFVDKCLRTISHMEQWIRHDPARNFVMPPSKWFDLTYSANIAGAYRKFLLPWKDTARQWKKRPDNQVLQILHASNDYEELALMLQKHLTHLHHQDQRIPKANLTEWTCQLQKLHQESKMGLHEIRKLILWLIKSPSKRAVFWREESGGFGIRSAGGLRRNFTYMHTQMMQEQSYRKS